MQLDRFDWCYRFFGLWSSSAKAARCSPVISAAAPRPFPHLAFRPFRQ
jgi:hypothetical protein